MTSTTVRTRSARYDLGSVENILATYALATADERAYGRVWYAQAHDICVGLSVRYELPLETVVGVVAALSPNNKWESNCKDAERLLIAVALSTTDTLKVSTYHSNKEKALAVAHGADFNAQFSPDARKVRAFRALILDPSAEICVVDSHAYAIWCGTYMTVEDVQHMNAPLYQHIVAAYVTAAELLGESVATVQAATWVAWHRLHADKMDKDKARKAKRAAAKAKAK